jgi:fructose-bisphosphate aldolase, class II
LTTNCSHIEKVSVIMKLSLAVSAAFLASSAHAFAGAFRPSIHKSTGLFGGIAEELDLPCEDECAIESYPNLPPSVHPGVLSGQAVIDLLNHAKENGKALKDMNGSCGLS